MKTMTAKQMGPDLMLYDGEADSVHILNPSARMIYDLHRQGAAVAEIAGALRGHFEVPAEQALELDITRAIQAMAAQGLFGAPAQ